MEEISVPPPVRTSTSASSDPPERTATFREVFAIGEFRALFAATGLSWVGDYLAKIAVTVLVFNETGSAGAAAATFAISFAPWLLIGPILTALAERLPHRHVMIASDLVRMVTIGLVAFVSMPVWLMIVLLFLTALGNPPYDAARSALTPTILPGDKLVVGVASIQSAGQTAQITGYMVGGYLAAATDPRLALGIDAATFAISAIVIALFIKHRPAVAQVEERRNLLRETADGFAMVFSTPALRGIALLVFSIMLVGALPEGLGVSWAETMHPANGLSVGLAQGLIMIATPIGFIVGGLFVGRMVKPDTRVRLVRPLAVATSAVLVPALFNPPLAAVCVMAFLVGCFISGILPTTNRLFVQALPNTHRTRAFGVVQSGVQLLQGGSIALVGALANPPSMVPRVVGLWALASLGLVIAIAVLVWPPQERFTAAIERAKALNEAV
jgi:MFS family permease